jgi:hypothetical protein
MDLVRSHRSYLSRLELHHLRVLTSHLLPTWVKSVKIQQLPTMQLCFLDSVQALCPNVQILLDNLLLELGPQYSLRIGRLDERERLRSQA